MADPLLELLAPHLPADSAKDEARFGQSNKYLSRLLSLRLSDLTTAEPLSLSQASQSNLVSIQALSARSHRTTTASSDHLATLQGTLPSLSRSAKEVCEAIPLLDESAVSFATTYSKSRDASNDSQNPILSSRKDSQLLSRQADKLQDILELPQLLSTAIASAGSGTAGSANYSQALDLFAHVKRLQIVYPDSALIKSIQIEAETAMKDMIVNLVNSLRSPSLRLPAAIRTIGWLRRVVPELSDNRNQTGTQPALSTQLYQSSSLTPTMPTFTPDTNTTPDEGSLGLLFLTARLSTFLATLDALSPLCDLADQELDRRLALNTAGNTTAPHPFPAPAPTRRSSTFNPPGSSHTTSGGAGGGHQTERYLKRYLEVFRVHSFATIDMYRKIFPSSTSTNDDHSGNRMNDDLSARDVFHLPPALQSFPLHLVQMLTETLERYLPNITDLVARESLLMQVLYAANSLGRLGADFSMVLALLGTDGAGGVQNEDGDGAADPEWARVMKKHKVQSARLDALAAGQEVVTKREVTI